jgi:hypothetical protein
MVDDKQLGGVGGEVFYVRSVFDAISNIIIQDMSNEVKYSTKLTK